MNMNVVDNVSGNIETVGKTKLGTGEYLSLGYKRTYKLGEGNIVKSLLRTKGNFSNEHEISFSTTVHFMFIYEPQV